MNYSHAMERAIQSAHREAITEIQALAEGGAPNPVKTVITGLWQRHHRARLEDRHQDADILEAAIDRITYKVYGPDWP